jgi:hypothetical protein
LQVIKKKRKNKIGKDNSSVTEPSRQEMEISKDKK